MQIETNFYKQTSTVLGVVIITCTALSVSLDADNSSIDALLIISMHNIACFTLPNTLIPKSYRQALALSGSLSVLLSYALLLMTYKLL